MPFLCNYAFLSLTLGNLKCVERLHCMLAVLMAKKDPKLTQRKLAQELGLSKTTINKYYQGRPVTSRMDAEIIEKLCAYFECGIADLLELREDE